MHLSVSKQKGQPIACYIFTKLIKGCLKDSPQWPFMIKQAMCWPFYFWLEGMRASIDPCGTLQIMISWLRFTLLYVVSLLLMPLRYCIYQKQRFQTIMHMYIMSVLLFKFKIESAGMLPIILIIFCSFLWKWTNGPNYLLLPNRLMLI